jgi:hypothetical protein
MIRLLLLLVALGVGFGGGVYWAHHNPEKAARLAAEEEKRFIEAQIALNKRLRERLASLESKTTAPRAGGSSLLPSGQGSAASREDIEAVKVEAEKQEQELLKRLEALK